MRVLVRRMGEPFECGEGLFRREVEHARMSLDHLEVEGGHLIKEHLIGSKPRGMIGLVIVTPSKIAILTFCCQFCCQLGKMPKTKTSQATSCLA